MPGGVIPPEAIPGGAMPGGVIPPGGAMPGGAAPSPLDNIAPAPMGEAEMAADLEDRFDMVAQKKAELDTRKIADKNKLDQMKQEILGKFFEAMQALGVDLNDPSSINQFMAELEQSDPDFVVLLETAFRVLGPEDPAPQPVEGQDLMNKFGGLQEDVLRKI